MRHVATSCLLVQLALAAGCGESAPPAAADAGLDARDVAAACTPGAGDAAVDFSTVYARVIAPGTCGAAGECHRNPDAPSAGLDLSTEAVARASLLGHRALTGGFCSPADVALRVAPGDPDRSMLWRRVAGTTCAERMPLRRPPLSCEEQELIRAWIARGAR